MKHAEASGSYQEVEATTATKARSNKLLINVGEVRCVTEEEEKLLMDVRNREDYCAL